MAYALRRPWLEIPTCSLPAAAYLTALQTSSMCFASSDLLKNRTEAALQLQLILLLQLTYLCISSASSSCSAFHSLLQRGDGRDLSQCGKEQCVWSEGGGLLCALVGALVIQYLELYTAFRICPRLETMGKTLRPRLSCPSLWKQGKPKHSSNGTETLILQCEKGVFNGSLFIYLLLFGQGRCSIVFLMSWATRDFGLKTTMW